MPYAALEDLVSRFGQDVVDVLDRDGDGDPDPEVADPALADASAEIDAIIAVRYPVPVTGAPWLKVACCDIARYRIYDDAVPEPVKDRYNNAINRLRSIRNGNSELLDEEGKPIEDRKGVAQAPGAIYETPRKRVFTDEGLKGFIGP